MVTKGRDIVVRKDPPLGNSMPIGNSFFLNLFGSIANLPIAGAIGSGADFIPTDANGNILKLNGQDSAAWLGMKNKLMQKYAYEYCFPLSSVVDRLAEYDISGNIEIYRLEGKGKENPATNTWSQNMRKLMLRPNPLQGWQQFRAQQIAYKKTFGYCPVLPIVPTSLGPEYAQAMINLPPWLFTPIMQPGANLFTSTDINQIVQGWRVNILGRSIVLRPDQVFILDDGYMQDEMMAYVLPMSRLVGLDMAISNLCASMEADNVLLRKRGPLGFITHAPKSDPISGNIAMSNEEKEELQNSLQQYGLNWAQFQFAISRQPVKWESMGYNVTELGTKETIIAAERAICHRFAYPFILYEEQDATYANGGNAKKGVYQDNVIPGNKKDLGEFGRFFQAAENNCDICGDFSHVAAFQEDEKFKGQAAQLLDQALQIEWLNNVITLNQWRTMRGYDTTADGDVYSKDLALPAPATSTQIQPTAPNQ